MAWWNRRSRATGEKALSPVFPSRGGWFSVMESFPGAWQRNIEINKNSVLTYHAVFACQSRVATDISKLPLELWGLNSDGVWVTISNPAYSPVLRRPNRYQTPKQFLESWVISKLQSGNTYVLKERDARNVVVELHVLDPKNVTVLVADDGTVFYDLAEDKLAGVTTPRVVNADEIIHDRNHTNYHPLVGLSPLVAAGLAATQGLAMQEDSAKFFQNGAQPGGILSAPGAISADDAARLKEHWTSTYGGKNAGSIAVVGDGLKYEALKAKAIDSQMVEQMKWTAEIVCGIYHVPAYMVGVGPRPAYDSAESAKLEYYELALDGLVRDIVTLLDDGLGLDGQTIGVDLDLEQLKRMDVESQMDVLNKANGIMTPNEQRKRINLGPTKGGDVVLKQEQDHSLAWLEMRDAQPLTAPEAEPVVTPEPDNDNEMDQQATKALLAIVKGLR